MTDMKWKDAILRVLEDADDPVHYSDIAQAIIDRSYRTSVGATPAATVAATISLDLKTQVVRTSRGHYALAGKSWSPPTGHSPQSFDQPQKDEAAEDADEMGLINAFGMFWRRQEVHWTSSNSRLLGVQQSGSQEVDFREQAGVYLLYDADRVIYVGRVAAARLGSRLWEHTRDRLTSRWDRFSWFGVRPVSEDGSLGPLPSSNIETSTLIATMEALLIEGLEPPQNRRQGDGFNSLEYVQKADPEVLLDRKRAILSELSAGLTT